MERRERLTRLVVLQEKLKKLHETRHALHLASAAAAEREAAEIAAHIDREDSLAGLFPDLYHRGVARANERRIDSLSKAQAAAADLAASKRRAEIAQKALDETLKALERREEEKAQLEHLERRLTLRK